jgi:predicted nucleic acid-binding protein
VTERHAYGVLDTSVVIDLPVIPEVQLPVAATITTITLAELSQGPHLTRDDRERAVRIERLQLTESMFRSPLPFDASAARKFGSLVALTVAAGRKTRARRIDLLIAAIATAHGLPLFTRNGDDFIGLKEAVTVVTV